MLGKCTASVKLSTEETNTYPMTKNCVHIFQEYVYWTIEFDKAHYRTYGRGLIVVWFFKTIKF